MRGWIDLWIKRTSCGGHKLGSCDGQGAAIVADDEAAEAERTVTAAGIHGDELVRRAGQNEITLHI